MKKIKINIRDSNFGRQYSTLTEQLEWINVKFLDYTPVPELLEGTAYVEADRIWVSPPTDKYKAAVFIKGNISIKQITIKFE